MIALHTTVHNGSISLLSDTFPCSVNIDPVWIPPHTRIYLPKFDRSTCVVQNRLFERRVEISVVEKHIRVMKPPIEVSLHRLY